MGMVDGGELFARALKDGGVEQAFVLCGGHTMPIFYGMRDVGIDIIDTRHECAAMHAAIGYARASGKAAVVVTTAGPGVANTPAGMMEAQTLGIPVVCVISNDSGWGMIRLQQKDSKRVAEKGHCNVDLHHMRAYEKMAEMWGGHGEMVTDPEEIVPALKRAVANGKPSIINVEVDREIANWP